MKHRKHQKTLLAKLILLLCIGSISLAIKTHLSSPEVIPIQTQKQSKSDSKKLTIPKKIKTQINPNTATISQLSTLPSIGPKKAALIIQSRKENPFTSYKDLTRVKGIGIKTAKKLKPRLIFENQTGNHQ